MRILSFVTVLALLLVKVNADVYLHNPRGTNGRCDEKNNDRQRGNRLFDSQNNNAGGYATCGQEMYFYENTDIDVQWTSQHGCGNGDAVKTDPNNPETNSCNVVIQLGCEDAFGKLQPASATQYWPYKLTEGAPAVSADVGEDTCLDRRPTFYDDCIRDPNRLTNACSQLDLTNAAQRAIFADNNGICRCHPRRELAYGMHEPEITWHKCIVRARNKGLFTADQQFNQDTAANTRQDSNGVNNRNGFECTEERDYWPYWHPTGWRDIAVKTSDTTLCDFYQKYSENVVGRGECINALNETDPTFWVFNTQGSCEAQRGATWIVRDPLNLDPPDCQVAEWTLDNHLGLQMSNSGQQRTNLESYKMTIPAIVPQGQDELKCVLRLRYNISNANVKFFDDSRRNGAVKTNPVVYYGNKNSDNVTESMPLRLAIDTSQFGRTFEDRSPVFRIRRRPVELSTATIHNLNVRGKRGNIAQVRNCVEYDFVPQVLSTTKGDYVHFQWCGSDFNDPNNAGQGKAGTDRSNIVALPSFDDNMVQSLFNATPIFAADVLSTLAYINQNKCFSVSDMVTTQAQNQQDTRSCHFLNGALTPYFDLLAPIMNSGVFYYMSTRNNAFSNRAQKGVIIATEPPTPVAVQAAIGGGVFAGLGLAGAISLWFYRARHGSLQGLKHHVQNKI
ncbi:hypothetical protein BJ742DRAFT_851550 [Cladochytrium replicatum]|nr:hypothetical protein BJ742DRAFT_851550 [Cladochytrium replicatum]